VAAVSEEQIVALMAADSEVGSAFILDSACTAPMVKNKSLFSTLTEGVGPKVLTANGFQRAAGVGTVKLITREGASFDLNDVLYMPGLPANLLSVPRLAEMGVTTVFSPGGVQLTYRGATVTAKSNGDLAWLTA
jgi:hypothetical protein